MTPGKKPGISNLGCLGIMAVVALVIALVSGLVNSGAAKGPCQVAQQAYVLATTLDDPEDAQIAALQYAVKKAECEAQGGTVGR
jgi:hypothetical protein